MIIDSPHHIVKGKSPFFSLIFLFTIWYNRFNENGGIKMLISTKGRYSLRVMVDLAEHQTDGFIPLKVIA